MGRLLLVVLCIFPVLLSHLVAAQRVMRCPMGAAGYGGGYGGFGAGGYGGYGGYGGGMGGGTYCGTESIFHYYTCCDYNLTQCCFNLEAWVIVVLIIIGLLSLVCCLACCGACFWGVQKASHSKTTTTTA